MASTRQSENPSAGRCRKCPSASATLSESCTVRCWWFSNISTTVAMAAGALSYTETSTHTASTSTRCDTQAPGSTNLSAAATCLGSSRATSRTSTLVSTARTAPLDVPPNALLQIAQCSGLWGRGKHRPMHVLRRITPCSANDDLFTVVVPLNDGSRTDPEFPANLGRHGDLTLRGELRMRQRHSVILPR